MTDKLFNKYLDTIDELSQAKQQIIHFQVFVESALKVANGTEHKSANDKQKLALIVELLQIALNK